jgi:hypothetical protein
MNSKICTKCGIDKELSHDNFHWDKRLYNGIGGFVSACKPCKNVNKQKNNKLRRERLAELGIKEHLDNYKRNKEQRLAYAKRPEVVERRKQVVKKRYANNPLKFLDYKKEYREKNKERYLDWSRKKDKQSIDNLTDAYISGVASRFFGISRKEVYEIPHLIETYRLHIKIKRIIGFNNPPLFSNKN